MQLTLAIPERASLALAATGDCGFLNIVPGAGEEIETTGGVLSIFTVTEACAVFPAMSVAVPFADNAAPSVESVIGDGQLAIPESASVQAKVTTTSVLFHPAALAGGEADAEIAGAVLSMFRVIVVCAVFPATSVTVPVMA